MSDLFPQCSTKEFRADLLQTSCAHVIESVLCCFQGLEAAEDVSCDRPLIEYKGKVMLREQYDKENVFFKQ